MTSSSLLRAERAPERAVRSAHANVSIQAAWLITAFTAFTAVSPAATTHVSVLTGDEVVQILDQTVEWYRTLGTQQQTATQPSDLLILYANRQTADQVIGLAFQIARANAELLSSEATAPVNSGDAAGTPQALELIQKRLDAKHDDIQAQVQADQKALLSVSKNTKAPVQAKISELQGELAMVNARRNFLDTLTQFASESDAKGSGASALKAHIDAIAVSIPSAAVTPAAASAAVGSAATSRFGIWDLAANVLRLSAKIGTIEAIDTRTAALQDTFTKIGTAPLVQLKTLSARGDALSNQADTANSTTLNTVRDQFDTLAWLFKQTSDILIPLSKEGVLLKQYRHNLGSWRDTAKNQYHDALKALGVRVGVLAALLAIVFGGAELWQRTVMRFAQDARRRYQLLLLRKITMWTLVVIIVGLTFATELSSFVTFAGLLTAGLAVAMQSVLLSVVGYFFLIGKFGIRVGDRVQIGTVTGEVIDIGLVRLHLMELSGQGPLGATGRVVAFANSIVFQTTGGLSKQIPGVNFAWHEMTLTLPAGKDEEKIKNELLDAAAAVIKDYREDFVRQTREIERTTASSSGGEATPQVQLHFSATGVEALVRYPVQLQHAAEIDERVSKQLMSVIGTNNAPM